MLKPTPGGATAAVGLQGRGLTLIEMMVTVTLLGALLLAVAPSAAEWMRSTEVRNAAESIAAGLQRARAEAVRRNQAVLFSLVSTATSNPPGRLDASCVLSSESASWVVSLTNPTNRCHMPASESVNPQTIEKYAQGDGALRVKVAVLDDTCASDPSGSTAKQVRFTPLGQPAASPTPLRCLEITHSAGTATAIRVKLDAGGGVRTCLPGLPAGSDDPRAC